MGCFYPCHWGTETTTAETSVYEAAVAWSKDVLYIINLSLVDISLMYSVMNDTRVAWMQESRCCRRVPPPRSLKNAWQNARKQTLQTGIAVLLADTKTETGKNTRNNYPITHTLIRVISLLRWGRAPGVCHYYRSRRLGAHTISLFGVQAQ